MNIHCSAASPKAVKADMIAVFVPSDEALFAKHKTALGTAFPAASAALASGDFTGKPNTSVMVYADAKAPAPRILVVGLGEMAKLDLEALRRAAAHAAKAASGKKLAHLAVVVPEISSIAAEQLGEALTEGVMLAAYRFVKYFSSKDKKNDPPKGNTVTTLTLAAAEKTDKTTLAKLKSGAEYAQLVSQAVLVARNLANAPNNEIYPESLAAEAQTLARSAGFKLTVLDKKKIAALKMNGLLGVNQGSARPPAFLVMEHMNGAKNAKPIVLVGKGVTFDTGGISIKPSAGMAEMKADMHGAATVIATMYAVATLGLKLNVIGLVPSTDNMPSGSAIVPGDIITYSNGTSVEVDNTDAEGRLILADALIYAQRYKPQAVIDLATLTGACVVALGHVASGLMGTDDALKARLRSSGDYTHEYVCELPLYAEYDELIKSDVADIKNVGGRWAGAITAAMFLKRFVGDMPWAHLDIAGTAMLSSDAPYAPKGGSGVGVRLLCDALRKWA
jgi:leucyl aminopeptidase